MDLPLACKEGFIRQVIGWREFVHHVHAMTDGFRNLPHGRPHKKKAPGDGGYQRWSGHAWKTHQTKKDPDGGAAPSYLGNRDVLPPAYWGQPSGFHCLDQVVSAVWEEGYSHHITRLMILANLATLLDVSPRELTDWFWVAYTDAYDWVVEPNVIGMGTYALGELMTTKPYVSGTPYIQKMSDYCGGCAFDPKKNCPISRLYWAFLSRHAELLKENLRMKLPVATLKKRSKSEQLKDKTTFKTVKEILLAGERVAP
jgi:deoxyribodipyrimidine photolyase-related protein